MNRIVERDIKEFFNGAGRKKDYIGDLLTIKARNIKNCNLEIDKLTFKFNISPDPEYGIIKTRFRTSYYGEYKVHIGEERNFDTLLILGLNRDKKIIEKAFAIPEKNLNGKRFITITKKGQVYQRFKINERPYNDAYQNMKIGNYSLFEDDSINIIQKT